MGLILGIDPGSRITGYGLIEVIGQQTRYVESGCLRLQATALADRLRQLYVQLTEIIEQYRPDQMAIEQVFMASNPDSALKLGQARGVAIVATACQNIPVAEYSARQVKKAVVGRGAADKQQVQHMIKILLNIPHKLQADAADALGIALCHAHAQHFQQIVGQTGRIQAGRLQG